MWFDFDRPALTLKELFGIRRAPSVCYLCGDQVDRADRTQDHVPAKQFFPPSLRRRLNPRLRTLTVHTACNHRFQADEDYFVYSVGTVSHGTPAGTSLVESRILPDVGRIGFGERVAELILRDVSAQEGGVWLPPGRLFKKFDSERIGRVVWKIVRGLWFIERRSVLPERTKSRFRIYSRDDPPDPMLAPLLRSERKGEYPFVFAYWSLRTLGRGGRIWETWALSFWDSFLFFVIFHCSTCSCSDCQSSAAD
jgi:hypothetical protein